MKLLRKTFGAYIIVALPVFILSMGGFFYFLRYVITKQVDASLQQDKTEITEFVNNNKNDVTELYKSISCSYYLKEIPKDSIINDRSRFVAVYDSVEQEYKPIRELRSTLRIKDKNYEIVLYESFVKSDSLIYSIASFTLVLLVILTIGISIVQVFIAKQIWEPFKKTLQKISRFKPGSKEVPDFSKTPITEFTILNKALAKMVERINTDFELQKTFIDNVSHELQTPISVISAQLELLIQEIELKESSATIINVMEETLHKMRKVNHALLLLSRIENDQFVAKRNVKVPEIISTFLLSHNDQIEIKQLKVACNFKEELEVNANQSLIEILIGNLLTNSIIHNKQEGEIIIEVTKGMVEINNTGEALNVLPDKLFEKYIHFGSTDTSLGIGLSIVKEICDYYEYEISYQMTGQLHAIKVNF